MREQALKPQRGLSDAGSMRAMLHNRRLRWRAEPLRVGATPLSIDDDDHVCRDCTAPASSWPGESSPPKNNRQPTCGFRFRVAWSLLKLAFRLVSSARSSSTDRPPVETQSPADGSIPGADRASLAGQRAVPWPQSHRGKVAEGLG